VMLPKEKKGERFLCAFAEMGEKIGPAGFVDDPFTSCEKRKRATASLICADR